MVQPAVSVKDASDIFKMEWMNKKYFDLMLSLVEGNTKREFFKYTKQLLLWMLKHYNITNNMLSIAIQYMSDHFKSFCRVSSNLSEKLNLANSSTTDISTKGDAQLFTRVNERVTSINLKEANYVPDLRANSSWSERL